MNAQEIRDEAAAIGAVKHAADGGNPLIAVDDGPKVDRMVERVKRVADGIDCGYDITHVEPGFVKISIGRGWVAVASVEVIEREMGAPEN